MSTLMPQKDLAELYGRITREITPRRREFSSTRTPQIRRERSIPYISRLKRDSIWPFPCARREPCSPGRLNS